MGLLSQGGIDTTAGIAGLALMSAAVILLVYAVVKIG